jgi:peptidoglycan/LPS O-acetylase OafA/YrhL
MGMKIWSQASELAAQTPAERNRYVDFLRFISILVVIVGHWLIATAHYVDGELIPGHLLESSRGTQWLTWLFQVMPIFFIVGGYANAVSLESAKRKGIDYAGWLAARLNRLVSPLLLLLVVWAGIAIIMSSTGVKPNVIQYVSQASLIPIWFLAIYIMVVILAPLTYRFWRRYGFASFWLFVAAAILVDVAFFVADIKWLGWSNFFWVWLAVHHLGYAWRDGRMGSARQLLIYSAMGFATLWLLVKYGPYPLAMVGSPDEGLSNTSPPKITLLALGIFQFGLLLALEAPMRRALDNLRLWTATVLINSMIMTVYLWHITAMVIVVAFIYMAGGIGLGIEPGTTEWWVSRPVWIAILFIFLLPIALLLSPLERRARKPGSKVPSTLRQVSGAMFICLGVALLARFGFGGGPIPRLDLAAFAMVVAGAGIAGLLPSISLPKIGSINLKMFGIWFLGIAVAYSGYTYFRISGDLVEKEMACFDGLAEALDRGVPPELLYQTDYDRLQLLVEQSLVARSEMLVVSNRLRLNKDQPLASRDLVTLKSGSEYYLNVRKDLYEIANAYECGIDVEDSTLLKYNIDPNLRLKGVMLSLAAALTLYDNYMLGIMLFDQDDRLRKVLNDPDMGFGLIANKLAETTLAANSIETRHRARRAINYYEERKPSIAGVDEDSDFAYLEQLIDSSPSYNFVKKIRVGEIAANKFVAFERIGEDFLSDTGTEGLDIVSGLFGNTLGMFESRKGKLYGDEEARRKIQEVLQPLDILLEKTPFRLTDKLIPGHFGHVAIWTGSKSELIDAGVWDNLIVQQYADQVGNQSNPDSKDEQQIIEALRNGVQLNTLEHFLNVDDFVILRPVFAEGANDELVKEALIMAFRQLGKQYDFNFDVNTTDKIVCSELAYVSFPSVDWPTAKTLGRHSISPDNVAQLAWNNVPLKLVMFYHDGRLVEEDLQLEKMKELMSL